MGFSITSRDQIIDYEAVVAGCESLKKVAESFRTCGEKIRSAGDTCDASAISVDGKTFQPTMYETAQQVIKTADALEGYATNIAAAAKNLYNQQVSEYNRYLAYLQEQRKKEAESQDQSEGGTANE